MGRTRGLAASTAVQLANCKHMMAHGGGPWLTDRKHMMDHGGGPYVEHDGHMAFMCGGGMIWFEKQPI